MIKHHDLRTACALSAEILVRPCEQVFGNLGSTALASAWLSPVLNVIGPPIKAHNDEMPVVIGSEPPLSC